MIDLFNHTEAFLKHPVDARKCFCCDRPWKKCGQITDKHITDLVQKYNLHPRSHSFEICYCVMLTEIGHETLGLPDHIKLCKSCTAVFLEEYSKRNI